jgi:hypothetical protein
MLYLDEETIGEPDMAFTNHSGQNTFHSAFVKRLARIPIKQTNADR